MQLENMGPSVVGGGDTITSLLLGIEIFEFCGMNTKMEGEKEYEEIFSEFQ